MIEIWRAFSNLPETANAHPDLWKPSAGKHPDLASDEAVEAVFKERVEALAIEGLSASRDVVQKEIEALGVGDMTKIGAEDQHLDAVRRLQSQADKVQQALRAKEAMRQIPVGWKDPQPPSEPVKAPAAGPNVVRFEPGKPPARGGEGMATYDEVLKQYEPVEAVIAQAMANPALFGLIDSGGGERSEGAPANLEHFRDQRAARAQAEIGGSLHEMLARVEKAASAIGGSLDHRDLRPLHEKVTAQPPFTQAFERSVAEHAVAAHDDMKTWRALGLNSLQAVAMLIPGAAAIAPIVGAIGSTVQVGFSWADYTALKTARDARTGPGNDLVTKDQLDDAEITLVLDAAFAFLDGIGAVVARGARGARAAGNLADLAHLAAPERDRVLGEAMATMGPGPAIDAAGGIDAVRKTAGGTTAGERAEVFVTSVEDALADRLAEKTAQEASEPLLPEAQRFVAGRAQVAEPRALPSLLPAYTSEEKLQQLVERVKARPVAGWAGLTPHQRVPLVHAEIVGHLPLPPGYRLDPALPAGAAYFDVTTWEIVYSEADFAAGTITQGQLAKLRGIAVHEAEHGNQYLQAAAYYIQTSPNPNAAVADLKFKLGWDADAVDAAAASSPLDAAGLTRAKSYWEEFGGGQAAHMAKVEKAILTAHENLEKARGDWRFHRAVLDGMWERGVSGEALTRAAQDVTEAYNRAAQHAENIVGYQNLAIEKAAFARQAAFDLEQEIRFAKEAMSGMNPYMDQLVNAGLIVAIAGGAAFITYGVVELRNRSPAPAPPR